MGNSKSNKDTSIVRKYLTYLLPIITFIIGIIIPSPVFKPEDFSSLHTAEKQLSDTVNMVLSDGSIYDGTVVSGTSVRHGFGRLTTSEGSIYEGNWKEDRLPYGQRTTSSSVYRGRFDRDLNNEGFGIIEYSKEYISGKRKQGNADNVIVSRYIGNWHKNNKHGLGRAINVDGSMDFGMYLNGIYQKDHSANYQVGDRVYGIDVSHYQSNINWNELALYCDDQGIAYRNQPSDKKYMQPVLFAYIKATEGATIKDDTYSIRAIEAERHGIVKGAYHFMHLGSSVDDQVRNFVETANWTSGDMPPALDIEVEAEIQTYGADKLQNMVLSWLEKVEAIMHVRPVIYTFERIRNQYLNDNRFKKYDFWIARYSKKGPDHFDWQMWQMSDKAIVRGYDAGTIDINLFNGDYVAFRRFVDQTNELAEEY